MSEVRKTFSDILNFDFAIEPGTVVCKDGSFLAGWEIVGIDTETMPIEIIENETERVAAAITGFGGDYTFWTDFKKTRKTTEDISPKEFDIEALQQIQEIRNYLSQNLDTTFQNTINLCVQYKPDYLKKDPSENLLLFKDACQTIEERFGALYEMRRFKIKVAERENGDRYHFDELISYLSLCLDGNWKNQKLPETPFPAYLDTLLRPSWEQNPKETLPKVNGNYIGIISLDGFPGYTDPTVLSFLENLPLNFHVSHRFVCYDRVEQKNQVKKFGKRWEGLKTSLIDQMLDKDNPRQDTHAVLMENETEAALGEITSTKVSYGAYSGIITLIGDIGQSEKDVLEGVRVITKALTDFGVTSRLETTNALAAFMGRIPGHREKNPRRPFINSLNYADLIPISTIWTGEKYCPNPLFPKQSPALFLCKSKTGEPYWFNNYSGDVGHTLVLGPTGAGKSVLLGLMAASFCKYKGSRIIAFDKNRSLQSLTHAVGGNFFVLGSEGRALAPMSGIKTLGITWAANWICKMVELNNTQITPDLKKEITDAVFHLSDLEKPTLNELHGLIQNKEVRNIIAEYFSGSQSGYFDAKEDNIEWAQWTVFETDDLFNANKTTALLTLDYLFERISKGLDGRPTLLLLDEAWAYLNNDLFSAKINEWLKEFRKANASVVIASQSITDAVNSPIVSTLLESCFTKIYLPNEAAATNEIREQYVSLGLNSAQINTIAAGQKKRDYFVIKPEGQRIIDLMLDEGQLAILGRTSIEDSKIAEKMYCKNKQFWKVRLRAAYEKDVENG